MNRQILTQDRNTLIAQANSAANCWLLVSAGMLFAMLAGYALGL